jgi:hypothetical protein
LPRIDADDKGWRAPVFVVYLGELFRTRGSLFLFGPPSLHGFGNAPATFGCKVALLSNNSLTSPSNSKISVGCSVEHSARLLQLGNLAINLR